MDKILIFAGTTEGRILTEAICRDDSEKRRVITCVATEYGKHLLPEESENLTVLAGRMEPEEMRALMEKEAVCQVIDATHPYARQASANIREAAEEAGVPYLRLLREQGKEAENAVVVPDAKGAAEYLKKTEGNVLLTIGSKELAAFTGLANFSQRLYPRILPTPEMVKRAFDLGFDAGHIIAMQGPFSHETNLAMLRQTKAAFLVTKESGQAGGFADKLTAAKEAGAKVLLIGRPKEEGKSLAEVLRILGLPPLPRQALDKKEEPLARWFPFFVDVKGKKVLVAGAGKIASRRIRTLSQFDVEITVVAPELSKEVIGLVESGRVHVQKREFSAADLEGADLVLAAAGSREVNREIGILCRTRGIFVNVADRKEECDFYFPAVVRKGNLIAGLTAGGQDHRLAAEGSRKVRQALENRRAETGEGYE